MISYSPILIMGVEGGGDGGGLVCLQGRAESLLPVSWLNSTHTNSTLHVTSGGNKISPWKYGG